MYSEPSEKEKRENPSWLAGQAKSLLSGQADRVANAANLAALLFHSLDNLNWAGFYFYQDGRLIVGPFQGKPACVEIPMGKGVCGVAAETRTVQRVSDVHAFSGHIACDAESRSEIVLPLVRKGELIGVLDLDSPLPARFGAEDERFLKEVADIYIRSLDP